MCQCEGALKNTFLPPRKKRKKVSSIPKLVGALRHFTAAGYCFSQGNGYFDNGGEKGIGKLNWEREKEKHRDEGGGSGMNHWRLWRARKNLAKLCVFAQWWENEL